MSIAIKNRIEKLFERLGRLLCRHRFKTLLIMFFIFTALISQFPPAVNTSSEAMLHADDPGKIKYNLFREEFGNSSPIVLGIRGPNIFSDAFLDKLKNLHEFLSKNDIFVSYRNGALRISPHFYNNITDIEKFIDVCKTYFKNN